MKEKRASKDREEVQQCTRAGAMLGRFGDGPQHSRTNVDRVAVVRVTFFVIKKKRGA